LKKSGDLLQVGYKQLLLTFAIGDALRSSAEG
jgi:hypothetical protein